MICAGTEWGTNSVSAETEALALPRFNTNLVFTSQQDKTIIASWKKTPNPFQDLQNKMKPLPFHFCYVGVDWLPFKRSRIDRADGNCVIMNASSPFLLQGNREPQQ